METVSENTTPKCGEMIVSMIASFEKNGIQTVYLRHYEKVPYEVGNDIDLLVPQGMRGKAAELIKQSILETGWRLLRQVEFGPLSLFLVSEDGSQFMHVDLFDRIEWHWLEYADSVGLLERRQWNGMIHHPTPAEEVLLNVLTRLVYAGVVREKHRTQAQSFVSQDGPKPLITAFIAHLGVKSGRKLADLVVNRDWEELIRQAPNLRRSLLRRSIQHAPGSAMVGLWRYLRRATLRLLRPPGPFLVFEGADGVGKSTVMERILPLMKDLTGKSDALMFHWKPTRKSIRIAGEPSGAAQNPRGKTLRSMALSFFFLGYHWLGFWTGYLRHVLPARARNRAVIGDRYAYEFFLDPDRLRLNLPQWLLRMASATVPQPDLVLCLVADSAAVITRKQELSEAEINRYQQKLTSLATGSSHFSLVQADGSIEESTHATRERILSCLYFNK